MKVIETHDLNTVEGRISARKSLGISQRDISKTLLTSYTVICNWEKGKHNPSAQKLEIWKNFLVDGFKKFKKSFDLQD